MNADMPGGVMPTMPDEARLCDDCGHDAWSHGRAGCRTMLSAARGVVNYCRCVVTPERLAYAAGRADEQAAVLAAIGRRRDVFYASILPADARLDAGAALGMLHGTIERGEHLDD